MMSILTRLVAFSLLAISASTAPTKSCEKLGLQAMDFFGQLSIIADPVIKIIQEQDPDLGNQFVHDILLGDLAAVNLSVNGTILESEWKTLKGTHQVALNLTQFLDDPKPLKKLLQDQFDGLPSEIKRTGCVVRKSGTVF